MRFARVKITSDVEKLWKCEGMRRLSPTMIGKLPKEAGKKIRVIVPPVKNIFCNGEWAWVVVKEGPVKNLQGTEICSHQIDVTDACFDVRLAEEG